MDAEPEAIAVAARPIAGGTGRYRFRAGAVARPRLPARSGASDVSRGKGEQSAFFALVAGQPLAGLPTKLPGSGLGPGSAA